MSKPLIIYHYDEDGFGAVWAFLQTWSFDPDDVDLVPSGYKKQPLNVSGRDVYMLDICFDKEEMLRIQEKADSLLVIDHHPKAIEAKLYLDRDNIVASSKYSACVLVWKTYYDGDEEMPWLLEYIQDRDLWRFELENSKEINSYIKMLPHDFEVWDELLSQPPEAILEAAKVARQAVDSYVEATLPNARMLKIPGCDSLVPVVNAPYWATSDLLNVLAGKKVHPEAKVGDKWRDVKALTDSGQTPAFAVGWYETADGGRKYSLRSAPCSVTGVAYNVGEFAEKYGGGGHKSASGFYLKPGETL